MINNGYGGTFLKMTNTPRPAPPVNLKINKDDKMDKYEILLKEIINSGHKSIDIDLLYDMYRDLKSNVDVKMIVKRYLK